MKKEQQIVFYKNIGLQLTRIREDRKISISQLATKSGLQFNTVNAAMDGNRFSLHVIAVLSECLGFSIDELLLKVFKAMSKESIRDIEESIKEKENREAGLENFI